MALKSIKKNYLYSLIAKIVALIAPLIVTPYVSRIIGADGAGVCSYITSLVSYFVLFANLGIESYALREISMHRDDHNFIKKFAIEITIMKAILTLICLVIYYVLFIAIFNLENQILYIIYSITLISVAFNFTWFYQGIEKFNILALASILTKLIYVSLIFIFVKEKSDLNIYALIVVSMTLLEYVVVIPFLFVSIKGKVEGKINPFIHLKSCMVYFLPTVAVEIYTVVDKTMIGLITKSDFENGYYEYAEKLVKMPLTVITAINAIMESRMAYYYSYNNHADAYNLTIKSANFSFMLSFPMAFGAVAIARTAIPLYLGDGYEKCITLIYILAWLLPIISISNLLGSHYYTPFGKRKTSAIFLTSGALVNIILNSFMIYLWQSIGAAIASIVAELLISVLYVIFARKFLLFKTLLNVSYKYIISSVIMGGSVLALNIFLPTSVWYLILEITIGIIVYSLMLLILRTRFFFFFLKFLFNKISKKRNNNE